jgi:hypothetical protein
MEKTCGLAEGLTGMQVGWPSPGCVSNQESATGGFKKTEGENTDGTKSLASEEMSEGSGLANVGLQVGYGSGMF